MPQAVFKSKTSKNMDCLFASLVLSMAAATKKKKRKEEAYPWKAGTSSGHITNLKQSILDFRYLWLKSTPLSKNSFSRKYIVS